MYQNPKLPDYKFAETNSWLALIFLFVIVLHPQLCASRTDQVLKENGDKGESEKEYTSTN